MIINDSLTFLNVQIHSIPYERHENSLNKMIEIKGHRKSMFALALTASPMWAWKPKRCGGQKAVG